MKDIVENRQRLSVGQKAEMAKLALQENGVLWTALLGTYYAFSGVADKSAIVHFQILQLTLKPKLPVL